MNVLNRIFMVLLLMALIVLAVAAIVLAWSIPGDSIAWLRNAADWLADNNDDTGKSVLSAVAAGIAFVALVLLILELLPRSTNEVRVTDLRIGDAYLSTASISQRVEEVVSLVPHVSDVKASITSKRKGVRVALDLHVDPDANLAIVTDEACEAARDVLTNRVHVALVEPPRARLHYSQLRLQRGAAANRRPLEAATAAPQAASLPPVAPLHAVPVYVEPAGASEADVIGDRPLTAEETAAIEAHREDEAPAPAGPHPENV